MKIKNIKRTIFILLAFLVTAFCGISLVKIITFVNNNPAQKDIEAAEEWRGSGVESDPYLIESISGMNSLASKVNKVHNGTTYSGKHFKLTTDLDYEGGILTPIGNNPLNTFNGNFDGDKHTISNAKIKVTKGNTQAGVFGSVQFATIKNLKIEYLNVEFEGENNNVSEGVCAGGIVGVTGCATIECCEVENFYVTYLDSFTSTSVIMVGGIFGYASSTTSVNIRNCGASVDSVNFTKQGTLNAEVLVSGIGNSNGYAHLNINYCFGTVYASGENLTKIREITDTIPYGYADEKILLDWVDYTAQSYSGNVVVKNTHGGWWEDYSIHKFKNLAVSSEWGSDSTSIWYFDDEYNAFRPYLRMFMESYTYKFTTVFKIDGQVYKANFANEISPTLFEGVPFKWATLYDESEPETTLLDRSVSYKDKEGYTFIRWNWVEEGEYCIEYQAVLNLVNYGITYDLKGAESSGLLTEEYTIETETFTLNNPTKTGYIFKGWTGSNGTTPQTTVKIEKGSTGDKSYTAHWELEEYPITYDLDGGSLPSDKTNPSKYTIESDTFTLNNPTKTGYEFKGWTVNNGSTPQMVVSIKQGTTGNLSFKANWHEEEYTITYVLNGGTAEQNYKTTYTIEETELILNYTPTKDGCVFVGWSGSNLTGNDNEKITIPQGTTGDLTFEANWKNAKVKLSFEDLSNIYSDVTNSTVLSFDVAYNTQISLEEQLLSTGTQLMYKFKDYGGNSKSVSYNIPIRYKVNSYGDWENLITDKDRFIDIEIAVKNYSIDFGGSNGSWGNWQTVLGVSSAGVQSASSSIEYGQLLEYDVTTENITIKLGNQQRVFTPNDGYEVKCLEITYNGTTLKCYPGESGTITVTSSISINAVTIKLFKVTFVDAVDENGETGKAQLTASTNPITIRNGDSVTGSFNNSTITYKYNGKTVATYTLEKYYTILNMDEIENVNDSTDLKIQPTIRFHACLVTFENVSKDNKDSNKAMATMSVEKDNYPTNNDNDGIFVVEFNTTVNAVKSGNSYIYTFSSGEVVTFTVEEKYEIESYGLDSDKEETHYEFSNQNEKEKTISPTFKVKKYKLTIIKNGEEVLNEDIYHSSKINYSANLSVSNNSYFEFEYESLYNDIETVKYQEENWFLEYFVITNEGESPEKIYIDNTYLDNIEIMVDSNVSIELQFVTFYKIGFETNIEGTTFNSEYADEINVKSGSSILGSYNSSTRLLQYTLTYNAYEESQESVVAEYTLMQYYLLIDADNIDSASEDKVIKPIIEFGACRVFMGDISNKYGVRDGLANFIVEFGTEVEFKAERKYDSTKDCYNFIYTYTFAFNGSIVQTVTYTVLYDEYAMFSDLTKEGRVWHTNITSQNLTKTEIREDNIGKVLEIRPEFGYKKYDGEMS